MNAKPELQPNLQPALVYARVSSTSQATNCHGLESQESRCREYALSKGYNVEVVFPTTYPAAVTL